MFSRIDYGHNINYYVICLAFVLRFYIYIILFKHLRSSAIRSPSISLVLSAPIFTKPRKGFLFWRVSVTKHHVVLTFHLTSSPPPPITPSHYNPSQKTSFYLSMLIYIGITVKYYIKYNGTNTLVWSSLFPLQKEFIDLYRHDS